MDFKAPHHLKSNTMLNLHNTLSTFRGGLGFLTDISPDAIVI